MGKWLAAMALAALWLPTAARVDQPIRYRLPDGSIGFADELARVPPGAVIVSRPADSREDEAEPVPGDDRAAEYSDERDALLEAAREQRKKAQATPCEYYTVPLRSRRGRLRGYETRADCSAKREQEREAEALEKALPAQLEAIEDRCMDDPDCAPRDLRELPKGEDE